MNLKYCKCCKETKLRSLFPKRGGNCKTCRKLGVRMLPVINIPNSYSFFTPSSSISERNLNVLLRSL
jgi:hypothetical protein